MRWRITHSLDRLSFLANAFVTCVGLASWMLAKGRPVVGQKRVFHSWPLAQLQQRKMAPVLRFLQTVQLLKGATNSIYLPCMIMAGFYLLWENLQVSDLEEELNKYWGSLSCPSSDGHHFWGHEWEKHGTCSLNLDEHSYFQKSLLLRQNIDILGSLKAAGIKPDGSEYRLRDIKESIRQSTGQLPGIDCNRSDEGKHQLYQVFVCVDKWDTLTVIECPIYPHSNCPSMLVFPPFGEDDQKIQDVFTIENITNGTYDQ